MSISDSSDSNGSPASADNQKQAGIGVPVIPVVEDTAPPMVPNNSPAALATEETLGSNGDTTMAGSSSGSAAPANDIVSPVVTGTTPKKKFAGGKIIATILGLLLLVGGVGAGTYLVQQNQNINEKAGACGGMCGSGRQCAGDLDGDGDGDCVPRGSTDEQIANNRVEIIEVDSNGDGMVNGDYAGAGLWADPDGDGISAPSSNGCPAGTYQCGGSGLSYNFCLSAGSNKTCNQAALEQGYTVQIGIVIKCIKVSNGWVSETSTDGGACTGDSNNYDRTDGDCQCKFQCGTGTVCNAFGRGQYICKIGVAGEGGVVYSGGPCTLQNGRTFNGNPATDCFCGVVQVDTDSGHVSYAGNCGCEGEGDEPPGGTPPTITAQCQNIKAYSSTWTLLTNAQLAQLNAGDSVNFCVTGSATGESFNKARFTINGAIQAETTTVRPGGTDFCQSYVIPAGVTTFNVSAQIHHVTLGWK